MSKTNVSAADLRAAIDRLPRVSLAHLPTPLEECKRLSKALGGPRIFIKRDDCTGLAFGGNKTRHNEFILADALKTGADLVVWGAGVQSNNCRQTAAACAKLGLDCHLVLGSDGDSTEVQGNLLLDHLLGASIEIVEARIGPELDQTITGVADRFRAAGRKVFKHDRGNVKIKATTSYVLATMELVEQFEALSIRPSTVYSCASGSTGSGLALGRAALGANYSLRLLLPIRWPWDTAEDVAKIANQTAEVLGLDVRVDASTIDVSDDYVGKDYGVPTPECMEAIALLARHEGILLDPNYSGKAMAGMIDDVRGGRYSADEAIVFVHTGGTPALFASRDALVEAIPQQTR